MSGVVGRRRRDQASQRVTTGWSPLTLWRDAARSAQEIARFSKADAEAYPGFVELMGKVALGHIPFVKDLRYRGVLEDAPIRPRHLATPGALARLVVPRKGHCDIMVLVNRLCT